MGPAMSQANDNETPPSDPIQFSDLALAMGVDEDTLLQRFAEILRRREEPLNYRRHHVHKLHVPKRRDGSPYC